VAITARPYENSGPLTAWVTDGDDVSDELLARRMVERQKGR
jgi:hypothetical protein